MDKPSNRFTLQWFIDSASNWTRNLRNVPDIDIGKLKSYLTDSRQKTFDKDSVRAYKSLKAYKYFEEGFVQKLEHTIINDEGQDLYIIHAEVLASYQGQIYQTYAAIDKQTVTPVGGACACVAGCGEACSHIAAILFAVEDFVAQGLNQLPDDKSCTDRLCQWNKPSKRKVEMKKIHNIRIVKQDHGKTLSEKQTFDSIGFDPRLESDRTVDPSCKAKLVDALKRHNPECNFLRYAVTSDSSINPAKQVPATTMPEDFIIETLPPSLNEIKCACDKVKSSLTVSSEERHKLERLTIGQSDSVKWKNARKYRITASKFHKVFRMKSTTNPKSTLQLFLQYKTTKQTSAMSFGLKQENASAKRYSEKTGLKLNKKGLVLDVEFPYLGASVDRVTENGDKIVELKNPQSVWEMSIPEAAKKLKCLKLDENNEVILNPRDEYYTQIQGQMGILGIKKCDFVLCTKDDMLIHEVLFDAEFWVQCKKKLIAFYENIMLPEIVYPRVKYNNDPYIYEML